MSTPLAVGTLTLLPSSLLRFLLEAALQGGTLLLLALAICTAWRGASAAQRHLVWFLALAATGLAPLAEQTIPVGVLHAWSQPRQAASAPILAPVLGVSPTASVAVARHGTPTPRRPDTSSPGAPAAPPGWHLARAGGEAAMASISQLLALAWAGGAALMLSRCLLGHLRVARLASGSGRAADQRLVRLLVDEQARLGIRRRIRLAALPGDRIPSVAGWLRPLILLPAGADGWPSSRIRAVLAHELAHVARHDGLTQLVAEGVLALHWFNPLAWLAARRMHVEREFACDDAVLRQGWPAADYATQLVEVAELSPGPAPAATAMLQRTGLRARIEALVDASRPRQTPRRRFVAAAATAALAATLVVPVLRTRAAEPRSTNALPANPAATRPVRSAPVRGPLAPPSRAAAAPRTSSEAGKHGQALARLREALLEKQRQVDAQAEAVDALRRRLPAEDPDTGTGRPGAEANTNTLRHLASSIRVRAAGLESIQGALSSMPPEGLRSAALSLFTEDTLLAHLSTRLSDARVELELEPKEASRKRIEVLHREIDNRIAGLMEGQRLQLEAHHQELKVLDAELSRAEAWSIERSRWAENYFSEKRRLENDRIQLDLMLRKLLSELADDAALRTAPAGTTPEPESDEVRP